MENLTTMLPGNTSTLKVGQLVSYKNGQPSTCTGTVVKISGDYLTVIDNEAGMILWNAGKNVGSYIHISQLA